MVYSFFIKGYNGCSKSRQKAPSRRLGAEGRRSLTTPGQKLIYFAGTLLLVLAAVCSLTLAFGGLIAQMLAVQETGKPLYQLSAQIVLWAEGLPVLTYLLAGLLALFLAHRPRSGGILLGLGRISLFVSAVSLTVGLISEGLSLAACWQGILGVIVSLLLCLGAKKKLEAPVPKRRESIFYTVIEEDDEDDED